MTTPLPFRWNGEHMVPLAGFRKHADRQYVIGEIYRLEPIEDRSTASHNHEFAWLKEAWQNLPEDLADQYPSPSHLRKKALVEAGYFDETIIDAGSNAAALRVASYVRSRSEFSVVIVRGPLVVERTPKSQSRRAMDKKTFQESKTAIMDVIADLIGVTADVLTREAGRAA
jgi:hypothetical protein